MKREPCSDCLVLLEMLRTIRAHCVRACVPVEETQRRLRWAAETFDACCVDVDAPQGSAPPDGAGAG